MHLMTKKKIKSSMRLYLNHNLGTRVGREGKQSEKFTMFNLFIGLSILNNSTKIFLVYIATAGRLCLDSLCITLNFSPDTINLTFRQMEQITK